MQAIEQCLNEAIAVQSQLTVEMTVEKLKTPQKVLSVLNQDATLSLADVAKILDISLSSVERSVAKLKKQGLLTFEGPRKAGRWRVTQ